MNLLKIYDFFQLPTLQSREFWRLSFVSDILSHLEEFLSHASRLLLAVSRLDATDVAGLADVIDLSVRLLADEVVVDVLDR